MTQHANPETDTTLTPQDQEALAQLLRKLNAGAPYPAADLTAPDWALLRAAGNPGMYLIDFGDGAKVGGK